MGTMKTTTTDYEQDAQRVLLEAGGSIRIKLVDKKVAPWDDENPKPRHHYKIQLEGPCGGTYDFDYWDSIANYGTGKHPGTYNVLAALEWNTYGTFEDFCSEMGYDTDSRKAFDTYKACAKQSNALRRIFPNPEMQEKLQEIR